MKKFLTILAFFFASPCWATTYFVDNCVIVGSDSNNGTSAGTPWLTIAKVNGFSFTAGDTIQFERTCIWRETLLPPTAGTIGSHITFQDYGSGSKPSIRGSNTYNVAGNWTNLSGNIWYASSLSNDPAIFKHDGTLGVRKTSQGALGTQWDYFYDSGNTRLDVFSVGNPTTVGTVLEIAVRKDILDNYGGKDYIDYKNLDVEDDYAGPMWGSFSANSHTTFTNVDFKNSGGYIAQANGTSQGTLTGSSFTNWGINTGLNAGINYGFQTVGAAGPWDFTNNTCTLTVAIAATDNTCIAGDDGSWIRTVTGTTFTSALATPGAMIFIFRPGAAASTITIQNNLSTGTGTECIDLNVLEFYGPQNINVSYNKCSNSVISDTLDVDAIRAQSFTTASTILISYNVINGCFSGANAHGGIRSGAATGSKWRIVGNTVNGCDYGYRQTGTSSGAIIENNAWTNNRQFGARIENSGTVGTFDYNLFFGNVTNNYNGISAGAHDVTTDPKYTNAGAGDFTLQTSSPAIKAGFALGSPYQSALSAASSWPSGILTVRQFYLWTIGAYAPPGVAAPSPVFANLMLP